MPFSLTCSCGKSYNLKDEFAGQTMKCPDCGSNIKSDLPANKNSLSINAFNRNKFLLRQKHFAISEKYYVCDEQNNNILYIERPAHLFNNLCSIFGGILSGIITGAALGSIVSMMQNSGMQGAFILLTVIASLVVMLYVGIIIYKKRHVSIYQNDTKTTKLLEILQDKKFQFFKATYTINDERGQCIARLTKNHLYNFFRKRWYCRRPDNFLLCIIKEDSIVLSLLRRLFGPFFGLLRTNFIFLNPSDESVLGEFNRNFTIFDRYVLDMNADRNNVIDRRIALSIGVMLDTGEKR